jgi:hypothetical protein
LRRYPMSYDPLGSGLRNMVNVVNIDSLTSVGFCEGSS